MDRPLSTQSQGVETVAHEVTPKPVQTHDFRALYEAHFAYVWHSLRRMGVREADLEDLSHEVFVAFYRHLGEYDPARPLKPWLFGIAFRVASDYRRRAWVQREVNVPIHAVDGTPAADEQLELKQDCALVLRALSALDLDRRAVFIAHEIDGQSMPEIGAALSVSINTLYSRLRVAREQFAAAVRRYRLQRGDQ
jgi:RNA polymerase sigma-70 factor (ECF subfamily)